VLGAGITGLTAAWRLRAAGFAPTVYEKAPRVGGAIGAWTQDGWLHELGPNSLLEGSAEVAGVIDEIGLRERRLYAAAAAKHRYIVRAARPVAVPRSPLGLLGTPLFSARAKLALCGEPWRPRGSADGEESVADFVVRRLGREFLDYAINPLVGGVYAGDPARLSVRHAFPKLHALEQEHGSLIRGALKRRNASAGPKGRIFSFPNGLTELPAAMAATLGDAIRLGSAVNAIRRSAGGWTIEADSGGSLLRDEFEAVICALPADALARLQIDGSGRPCPLDVLAEIEQPPVATVFTGFRRADVSHALDGFGLLVPAVERRQILGTLFSSSLFPGRAPAGHVAMTTFVGGTRQPELATLDDPQLLRVVQSELTELVGARAAPVFTHIHRWARAIPQYTLGYSRYKEAIRGVELAAPGLFIGGNARDGISLANCIESGGRLASAASTYVRARSP
jgi:protoporphyrinogen/coproporphyrinogen III oxidase